ncbi:hypothetical protein CBS11350_427 [Aspergillus niger]|nr:hypothetical protein CBS11350_427 [Aspergillus niger]
MACPGAKLNPLASEFIWHGNKTGHMRVTEKGVSAKNANQVEVPEKNIFTKDTEQNFDEPEAVKFRVDVNPEKINNAAYFLEALVNLSKHLPSSKPYNAYRAHGNDPRINKTTVLATVAIFLRNYSFNILLVGARNVTMDALTDQLTALSRFLSNTIKTKAPGANFKRGMELIGIDVTDGKAVVNGKTRSRSNIANVTVVMELVEFLISRDALKGRTSAIITTYADQRKEYVRSLKKLSERLSIAWKDMIKIATVDSMQGHEVDLAILDWVVDSGAKSHLGFASDNRRTNVALTRARACLIVVANGAILNNDRLSERKPTHLHPEVLAHWNSLFLNGLVVDVRAGLMTSNADGQGEL